MPIQIIDGFQVNVLSPIDNRIVASGSSARNAIAYKYEGLRVFDLADGVPYVWYNGSWISENASGVVGTSTTASYIPLFTSSNVISNSIIYQSSGKIGINTTTPSEMFEVFDGKVKVSGTGVFEGNGSQISNINANSISSGSLALARITNGSNGWLLAGSTPNPAYINPTQISVGTSSVALASQINNTSSNSTNYLTFVSSTSGNAAIRVNSSSLTYNPATNLLTAATVSVNGIKFPSIQIASTDANTLDDYEEGTWTPTISGITTGFTYTSGGMYTKIGRLIYISGYIKYDTVTSYVSGAENNYIALSSLPTSPSGIPVSSASVGIWTINPSSGTVANRMFDDVSIDNGTVLSSYQSIGGTNLYFSTNKGSGFNPLGGGFSAGFVISFSLTFHN